MYGESERKVTTFILMNFRKHSISNRKSYLFIILKRKIILLDTGSGLKFIEVKM